MPLQIASLRQYPEALLVFLSMIHRMLTSHVVTKQSYCALVQHMNTLAFRMHLRTFFHAFSGHAPYSYFVTRGKGQEATTNSISRKSEWFHYDFLSCLYSSSGSVL